EETMKIGDMVYNHRTKKPCIITKIGSRMFNHGRDEGVNIVTVVNVGESHTTFTLMDRLELINAVDNN
ncbi:MAG TPA: hypothetical protein DCM40_09685, partial [Maribacter sp.]|nr:hypothetical protein [Maribacter sp.]